MAEFKNIFTIATVSDGDGEGTLSPSSASYWYKGEGAPLANFGKDKDLYLDTLTNDVYYKNEDVWNNITRLEGAQGEQGPVGPQGPKGDKGDKGDDGVVAEGVYGFEVENGNLILVTGESTNTPDYQINSKGEFIITIDSIQED